MTAYTMTVAQRAQAASRRIAARVQSGHSITDAIGKEIFDEFTALNDSAKKHRDQEQQQNAYAMRRWWFSVFVVGLSIGYAIGHFT